MSYFVVQGGYWIVAKFTVKLQEFQVSNSGLKKLHTGYLITLRFYRFTLLYHLIYCVLRLMKCNTLSSAQSMCVYIYTCIHVHLDYQNLFTSLMSSGFMNNDQNPRQPQFSCIRPKNRLLSEFHIVMRKPRVGFQLLLCK